MRRVSRTLAPPPRRERRPASTAGPRRSRRRRGLHPSWPRCAPAGWPRLERRTDTGPAEAYVSLQLQAPVGDHRADREVARGVEPVSSRTFCSEIQSSLSTRPCRIRMPRKVPPATTVASGFSARSRSASSTVFGMCHVTVKPPLVLDGHWTHVAGYMVVTGARLQHVQAGVVVGPLDVLRAAVEVGEVQPHLDQVGELGLADTCSSTTRAFFNAPLRSSV